MTDTINIHEAKTHFSKLIKRAHDGEEIILAKSGKPYARLLPLKEKQPRQRGLVKVKLTDEFFESLPEDELTGWNT